MSEKKRYVLIIATIALLVLFARFAIDLTLSQTRPIYSWILFVILELIVGYLLYYPIVEKKVSVRNYTVRWSESRIMFIAIFAIYLIIGAIVVYGFYRYL